MRRGKTQSLQPIDLVHRFEQLHKWTFIINLRKLVTAIQVYDLPEQSDFLHSARHQAAHFAHDLIYRTAALRSARLRDDAEGAMHVASLHDRNESGRLPEHEWLVANRRLRAGFLANVNNGKAQIVHW